MDGLEFTEKLAGHAVTLLVGYAWPAVIAFFLYTQRRAIADFLESIKTLTFKAKGVEVIAERAKEALVEVKADLKEVKPPELSAAAVPRMVEVQLPDGRVFKSEDEGELMKYIDEYSLAKAAQGEPEAVVLEAWLDVERALYQVVEKQERPMFTYLTGNDLFQKAAKEMLLDPKLLAAINGLLAVRNETVTGIMGWKPNRALATQYVRNAAEVVKQLRPYMGIIAGVMHN